MFDVPDLSDLYPHEIAQSCLRALVVLSNTNSTKFSSVYSASVVEESVEKLGGGKFLGNLVRLALQWLSERGFIERPGRDVYALTYKGEVAHTKLAYERHAHA